MGGGCLAQALACGLVNATRPRGRGRCSTGRLVSAEVSAAGGGAQVPVPNYPKSLVGGTGVEPATSAL
jgi:hypothetical protein